MNNPVSVILRPYQPNTDDPLIYSSWTKNNWYSPKEKITVTKGQWFKMKIQAIKQTLLTSEVRIACLSDDLNVICGYCVLDDDKPIWIWVKDRYRKQGIAKLLMKPKEK